MLSFSPGVTTQTISVFVTNDSIDEDNETFFVNLSSPMNATIARGQGTGTILDDDGPTISINDASVTEGGSAVFTANLSAASLQAITVHYMQASGRGVQGRTSASVFTVAS